MTLPSATNSWVIVPAAGVGSRMQADRPKQYLPLLGQYLMDHTLATLLACAHFQRVVLVLSDDDEYWPDSRFYQHERLIMASGGKERCDSVLSGLKALEGLANEQDWVAVHDVARPCVRLSDIDALFQALSDEEARDNSVCGAILATPTRDTMKRGQPLADSGLSQIQTTIEREQLWHALTPQVFRYAELTTALERGIAESWIITDEASALEQMGKQPLLVTGRGDNLKVTRPDDLALAEFFLQRAQTNTTAG